LSKHEPVPLYKWQLCAMVITRCWLSLSNGEVGFGFKVYICTFFVPSVSY